VDQIRYKPFSALKSLFNTTKNKGFITCLRQISPAKFSKSIKIKSPWLTSIAQNELAKLNNKTKIQHPHPQQFDLVYGISTAQSVFLENEHAFKHQVHLRHPFRDRRIVEFLMALPAWVLGDINNPKRFIRTTAKDLLPQSILNRNKISTLQPLFNLGVFDKEFEKVKEVLTDRSCQWQNYVKKELILNTLNTRKNQLKENHQVILWQCLNYELWRSRIAETSP
jgi:asparagine synthetase B (glutamine-hydrolysing)